MLRLLPLQHGWLGGSSSAPTAPSSAETQDMGAKPQASTVDASALPDLPGIAPLTWLEEGRTDQAFTPSTSSSERHGSWPATLSAFDLVWLECVRATAICDGCPMALAAGAVVPTCVSGNDKPAANVSAELVELRNSVAVCGGDAGAWATGNPTLLLPMG